MPHTVHYPEQPSQGHVTPPPSRDAPVRFVLCCVAKTDNIRIYLVFHDEFTQRLIEEGKMVSKSKAHCRRMLQALQQTRAGIFDQLENCQHTLPEYIAISSETSATLIHRGTMARAPECIEFANKHNMALVTIEDLVAYRQAHERKAS